MLHLLWLWMKRGARQIVSFRNVTGTGINGRTVVRFLVQRDRVEECHAHMSVFECTHVVCAVTTHQSVVAKGFVRRHS